MNTCSPPQNSQAATHPTPSPQKKKSFSTPPANINAIKDATWLNKRIAKKEFKLLCERGLKTVSKKLIFEGNSNFSREIQNPEEVLKILKLR